jgi:dihydroflavonol-4-reductase
VIGGTGFIGLNIIRVLKEQGISARCSRRPSSNTLFVRKFVPELVEIDLDEKKSLRKAIQGCDTVFMAAGHYPRFSIGAKHQVKIATARMRNLIEATIDCGVEKFIYTSSVVTADWQTNPDEILDESKIARASPPCSVYHTVKIATEQLVRDAVQKGLPAVILCPTGCLGEYDVKAGTGFFMIALAREKIKFYPEGRINIVDVEAAAKAHVSAAKRSDLFGKRYLLGGNNLFMSDLLKRVCERFNLPMPRFRIPLSFAAFLSSLDERRCLRSKGRRPFLAREFVDILRFSRFVNSSRAVHDLGLPQVSLEHTLDKTWAWFARYGYLGQVFKPARTL